MIAGPNGSGKSRIRDILSEFLVGTLVNADEIQLSLDGASGLDFGDYGLTSSSVLEVMSGILTCLSLHTTGYLSTLLADSIRKRLIDNRRSFTFETVMSSIDKIATLRLASACGFRTYLYYVATEDPTINVDGVAYRVSMGGHNVPEKKIRVRYVRSLGHLLD